MVNLLAFYRGKTLIHFLNQFPKLSSLDDDSDFYWDVIGSNRRNISCLKQEMIDGTVVDSTGNY